jgi:GTP-binding protein
MKIISAIHAATAVKRDQYPSPSFPEIAFAGRSNVGKSSLINRITNRKKLVRTSSTPGKTRTINFFLVNERWMLVDLPGYGYAKVPQDVRRSWRPMVEAYLKGRENLAAVVLIMDFRFPPTQYDLQMVGWLEHNGVAYIPTATKVDKVPRSKRRERLREYSEILEVDEDQVILFSAMTGEGRDALWRRIRAATSI